MNTDKKIADCRNTMMYPALILNLSSRTVTATKMVQPMMNSQMLT